MAIILIGVSPRKPRMKCSSHSGEDDTAQSSVLPHIQSQKAKPEFTATYQIREKRVFIKSERIIVKSAILQKLLVVETNSMHDEAIEE